MYKQVKLKDIAVFKNGKKKPEESGKIPVYGGNGIFDYTTKANHSNVIIIGRVGAYCGSVHYVPQSLWVSDNAIAVKNIEGVSNIKYLQYLLQTLQLNRRSIGTSQPLLTQTILKDIKINIPSLIGQEKIANILSSFDDKIENNNAIIANLEEQAQTIFKSWFVDFEPFQDGEFVESESEQGRIPKKWQISSLDKMANYKNGLAMQKYRPESEEKSLPVLKIKELRANRTNSDSDRCTKDIPTDVLVENGDIIFSWSGSLLVEIWTGGIAGLNQHLFKVTSNKYHKWFYYYWTKFFLNQFSVIARDRATTMGHIKRSHLKEAKIIIPDEENLEKMNKVMDPIVSKLINLGIQSKKLEETRDTLLPKLMSGEIRVEEALKLNRRYN